MAEKMILHVLIEQSLEIERFYNVSVLSCHTVLKWIPRKIDKKMKGASHSDSYRVPHRASSFLVFLWKLFLSTKLRSLSVPAASVHTIHRGGCYSCKLCPEFAPYSVHCKYATVRPCGITKSWYLIKGPRGASGFTGELFLSEWSL